MVDVGFSLQPDSRFYELLADVCEESADYLEVTPETLWFGSAKGERRLNAFARQFLELRGRTGKPFVAHGVGLSLGTLAAEDEPRFARCLDHAAELHERFQFAWYTDHLAASVVGGEDLILPLAIPFSAECAEHVRGRLERLQDIVPDVGVENTVTYFNVDRPEAEPQFLRRVLAGERLWQVLDLHNVYTMSLNFGFDPKEYVRQLDLSRVIEIHISGGSASDPKWLPEGRTQRLDSHDSAVPDAVWTLLSETLSGCSNLRGVTLERMEGSVGPGDVATIASELRRLKELCA